MEIRYNLLDKDTFEYIQNIFTTDNFPWFYNDSVAYQGLPFSLHDCQFTHTMVRDGFTVSKWYEYVHPLMYNLGIDKNKVWRVKVNCSLSTPEPWVSGMHTDFASGDFTTYVFYLNTNNGGTIFEDGSFVQSEENKVVWFDGMTKHSSVTTTDTKHRVVLNINVLK